MSNKNNLRYLSLGCAIKEHIGQRYAIRFQADRTRTSQMSLSPTKWTRLPHLTFVFLGLALAVCTWGLQYKLSLYDPPQAISHQMPKAKLLSQNERAIAATHPLISNAKTVSKPMYTVLSGIFILLLFVYRASNVRASGQNLRKMRRPRHPRALASLSLFFFRPPPVLF